MSRHRHRRRRRSTRRVGDKDEVEMTAMIDVVFQLLIYFIVTIKPVDVIAHLDVYRPSPDPNQKEQLEKPPKMIRIEIFADGFRINDRTVGIREMERLLARLASIDTGQTIMIMATALSEHEDLIKVLDLCAKHGLQNLSVISTN